MNAPSSNNKINKATRHTSQNEGLIFEKSSPGKRAFELPPLDVPSANASTELGKHFRADGVSGFPEVSEIEVVRHFTRLSTWNYAIDLGMYPLGSCTMKYNPRVNEFVARLDGIASEHPYQPDELSQGCLRILQLLEKCLLEITGMDAITLQPAAGAQGELTGLLLIRSYLERQGNPRKKVLIPDSAHGTNPATAVIAGYEVENIKSESHGQIDVEKLRELVTDDVAALMITNPSTLGIFEERIPEIAQILHAKGALLYMDGANMNALTGITRPGDLGVDVMHLNLHKTFSTPHGGGGPGAGPVAMKKILEPFKPVPVLVEKENGKLALDSQRPDSIGKVRAFTGNFGVLVRALAYILAYGPGVRQATEDAVLNANYIRKGLEGVYDLPYSLPSLHEVVFSDAIQKRNGVNTMDIAKRLIDYGFHPYTTAFPLIVPGALMIEPTESESKEECDLFIEAMKSIAEEAAQTPELVKTAPHTTRVRRLDEVAAARKPVLRWNPASASKAAR
ncbi:MAG TPA: aminomethyl-transferring glycine dehydrogenase subunit GcvPB [Candidatus Dormibacteraeota bacterium]|jgi:glycine dehydrogenase subunit 2|nr:aminomethyl-transferring glycine dehydrogenase subunit GcvPB [Candidatus Dormibacteraeota bacterium]